jgi:hypothetical protein
MTTAAVVRVCVLLASLPDGEVGHCELHGQRDSATWQCKKRGCGYRKSVELGLHITE